MSKKLVPLQDLCLIQETEDNESVSAGGIVIQSSSPTPGVARGKILDVGPLASSGAGIGLEVLFKKTEALKVEVTPGRFAFLMKESAILGFFQAT